MEVVSAHPSPIYFPFQTATASGEKEIGEIAVMIEIEIGGTEAAESIFNGTAEILTEIKKKKKNKKKNKL